jgi:hypothetical protein
VIVVVPFDQQQTGRALRGQRGGVVIRLVAYFLKS